MGRHTATPSIRSLSRELTARTFARSMSGNDAASEARRVPLGKHGVSTQASNRANLDAWAARRTVEVPDEQAACLWEHLADVEAQP